MDGLDQAIGRAESFEKEQTEKAKEFTSDANPDKQKEAKIPLADPMEAAGNMAETMLNITTRACQAFIDNRLCVDDKEIAQCRESMAPVIDKYNLAIGGGKIPYAEEVEAGLYLGGLWRRFRRAVGELRAKDKAEKQAREANNGSKREHGFKEPSHAVPGEVGLREKSNVDQEGGDSPRWLTGGSLG